MYQSTRQQVFAVITFCSTRGGIAVERTTQAAGEKAAIRMAERLAGGRAGAAAVARARDLEAGFFDDPVILACFGRVPPDLSEMLSA